MDPTGAFISGYLFKKAYDATLGAEDDDISIDEAMDHFGGKRTKADCPGCGNTLRKKVTRAFLKEIAKRAAVEAMCPNCGAVDVAADAWCQPS